MSIGVVLMAAGLSRRMGKDKLMLPWGSSVLIEPSLIALSHIKGPKVAVVSPFIEDFDKLKSLLRDYYFDIVINESSERGQSSSIIMGLEYLLPQGLDGILFAVGDQPFLTEQTIHTLIETFESYKKESAEPEKCIVLPTWEDSGKRGNPVLFGSYWFSALLQLTGDVGGRSILQGEGSPWIKEVRCTGLGGVDIDTPEIYRKLIDRWDK